MTCKGLPEGIYHVYGNSTELAQSCTICTSKVQDKREIPGIMIVQHVQNLPSPHCSEMNG